MYTELDVPKKHLKFFYNLITIMTNSDAIKLLLSRDMGLFVIGYSIILQNMILLISLQMIFGPLKYFQLFISA